MIKLDTHALLETQDIDILIGNETHLDNSIVSSEIFPPNFAIYRKDRNRNGGGVCIPVKDSIPSMEISTNVTSEQIWVQIHAHDKQINIGSIYRPPNDKDVTLNDLDHVLKMNKTQNSHTIVGGDLNLGSIDWENGSVYESGQGSTYCNHLLEICKDHCLEQMVTDTNRQSKTYYA